MFGLYSTHIGSRAEMPKPKSQRLVQNDERSWHPDVNNFTKQTMLPRISISKSILWMAKSVMKCQSVTAIP